MTQMFTVISRKVTFFVNLYSEIFKQSYFNIYNCDLDFVDSLYTPVLFLFPVHIHTHTHAHVRTATVWASQEALVVKNLPANTGDERDTVHFPGLKRYPGGRHSNPLQYCQENPMDKGAWWATVHRVTKGQT